MQTNINGYDNEFNFIKYLNGKRISELNPMFYDFIIAIFSNVNENDKILCWKNKYRQKADIFIMINGITKGVSIKKGSRNSVHVEPISEFIHFLIINGIQRDCIIKYLKYHYADGTTNGKGLKRISVSEYKKYNESDIIEINKAFNNEKLINAAIERFITKGIFSKYEIAAIIDGEVDDFLWITTSDIKKIINSKTIFYSSAVHIGPLFCQPKNRCLNHNPIYEKDRFCVQIKWYSLFDDIICNMNNSLPNSY